MSAEPDTTVHPVDADTQWSLFPAAKDDVAAIGDDATLAAHQRRRLFRRLVPGFAVLAGVVVLAFVNEGAAVALLGGAIALAAVWAIWFADLTELRGGLTRWAVDHGLRDMGGSLWSKDKATRLDPATVDTATRAMQAAGVGVRRTGYVAQLRGAPWRAATDDASILCTSVANADARLTIVSVPLDARSAERLRGVCVERDLAPIPGSWLADAWEPRSFERAGSELGVRVTASPDQDPILLWQQFDPVMLEWFEHDVSRLQLGIGGFAIADGQLEVWTGRDLLREASQERYYLDRGRDPAMYDGAADRLQSFLAHASEVHRRVVGRS
ncbi:MAG: hypothetical protein JWL76_1840 [Thermoleophilia bacterium]|nr:hypothetical protein [Thermoleophilia bacterium]